MPAIRWKNSRSTSATCTATAGAAGRAAAGAPTPRRARAPPPTAAPAPSPGPAAAAPALTPRAPTRAPPAPLLDTVQARGPTHARVPVPTRGPAPARARALTAEVAEAGGRARVRRAPERHRAVHRPRAREHGGPAAAATGHLAPPPGRPSSAGAATTTARAGGRTRGHARHGPRVRTTTTRCRRRHRSPAFTAGVGRRRPLRLRRPTSAATAGAPATSSGATLRVATPQSTWGCR